MPNGRPTIKANTNASSEAERKLIRQGISQEVPPSLVGASSRTTQRLISKQKIVTATGNPPHLSLLQPSQLLARPEKFTPKEVTLPTHRDDIFRFLRVFESETSKLSGEPKDFSSPIGAVLSQQSTSAESQKVVEKQD